MSSSAHSMLFGNVPPAYNAVMSMLDLYSWLKSRKRRSYSQHSEDLFVANFFAGKKKAFISTSAHRHRIMHPK